MKKIIRRAAGSFVAIALAFTFSIPTFASDLTNHWAEGYMTRLIDYGFMQGYEDGTFRPDCTMNKAEFATLMNRIFDFEVNPVLTEDAPWYANQLFTAKSAGYYFESPASFGRPDLPLTREEAAVMLNRIYNFPSNEEALKQLTDVGKISAFARDAVSALVNAGVLVGDENRNFNPQKALTRGEASTIIVQTVGDIIADNPVNDVTFAGNTLIRTPNVHLRDVKIEGNLFISVAAGASTISFTNVQVNGAVVVQGSTPITTDNNTNFQKFITLKDTTVNGEKVGSNDSIEIVKGEIKKLQGEPATAAPKSGGSVHYGSGSSQNSNTGTNTVNVSGVAIESGTGTNGNILTARLTSGGSSANVDYQWYRNSSDSVDGAAAIAGATSRTYTLTEADLGQHLHVKITAGANTNITNKNSNLINISNDGVYLAADHRLTVSHMFGVTFAVIDTKDYSGATSITVNGQLAEQQNDDAEVWRFMLDGTYPVTNLNIIVRN